MDPAAEQLALLLDLDARHDDLLERLEELDQRVANALAEYQSLSVRGDNSCLASASSRTPFAPVSRGGAPVLSVVVPEAEDAPLQQESVADKKSE